MNARRELLQRALEAATADRDDLSVEEILDLVDDTFRELPLGPWLAILRTPDPPQPPDLQRLAEYLRGAGATALLCLDVDVTLESLDDENLLSIGLTRIHRCPPEDSGIMPCCGRTPFEVRSERVTTAPALVTCKGRQ